MIVDLESQSGTKWSSPAPAELNSIWDLPVSQGSGEKVTYQQYVKETSVIDAEQPAVLPLPTSLIAAGFGLAFAVVARNRLRR